VHSSSWVRKRLTHENPRVKSFIWLGLTLGDDFHPNCAQPLRSDPLIIFHLDFICARLIANFSLLLWILHFIQFRIYASDRREKVNESSRKYKLELERSFPIINALIGWNSFQNCVKKPLPDDFLLTDGHSEGRKKKRRKNFTRFPPKKIFSF
jgi:hypothetical protein